MDALTRGCRYGYAYFPEDEGGLPQLAVDELPARPRMSDVDSHRCMNVYLEPHLTYTRAPILNLQL